MRLLTDHPTSVGETYLEHMRMALKFSASLALASGACAVHAFLPFLLKSSGSRRVGDLHRQMVEQRKRDIQRLTLAPGASD